MSQAQVFIKIKTKNTDDKPRFSKINFTFKKKHSKKQTILFVFVVFIIVYAIYLLYYVLHVLFTKMDGEWGNWGYVGQQLQTCDYKMSKFWESDVLHSDYS